MGNIDSLNTPISRSQNPHRNTNFHSDFRQSLVAEAVISCTGESEWSLHRCFTPGLTLNLSLLITAPPYYTYIAVSNELYLLLMYCSHYAVIRGRRMVKTNSELFCCPPLKRFIAAFRLWCQKIVLGRAVERYAAYVSCRHYHCRHRGIDADKRHCLPLGIPDWIGPVSFFLKPPPVCHTQIWTQTLALANTLDALGSAMGWIFLRNQ